jgi:cytochrome c553
MMRRLTSKAIANCMALFALVSPFIHASDANFDGATGVLSLPVVNVPGTGVVQASLNLTSDDPIQFTLQSAEIYPVPPVLDQLTQQVKSEGNDTKLYIPQVRVEAEYYEVNMTLLNDNPIVFGNLEVLSVSKVPAAVPDLPEASIKRGQVLYAQQCALCHGPTGAGTPLGPGVRNWSATQFNTLRILINNTMPLGNSKSCIDGGTSSCATDVSNYIIHQLK